MWVISAARSCATPPQVFASGEGTFRTASKHCPCRLATDRRTRGSSGGSPMIAPATLLQRAVDYATMLATATPVHVLPFAAEDAAAAGQKPPVDQAAEFAAWQGSTACRSATRARAW